MTREEKKRELKNYIFLESQIEDLKDRYEIEYTKAVKITACNTGMPHGNDNGSKAERSAVKLLEVSERLRKAQERKAKIDKAINELPIKYQITINNIDINSMSVSRFSKHIKRSYREVIRIHNKALDMLKL